MRQLSPVALGRTILPVWIGAAHCLLIIVRFRNTKSLSLKLEIYGAAVLLFRCAKPAVGETK